MHSITKVSLIVFLVVAATCIESGAKEAAKSTAVDEKSANSGPKASTDLKSKSRGNHDAKPEKTISKKETEKTTADDKKKQKPAVTNKMDIFKAGEKKEELKTDGTDVLKTATKIGDTEKSKNKKIENSKPEEKKLEPKDHDKKDSKEKETENTKILKKEIAEPEPRVHEDNEQQHKKPEHKKSETKKSQGKKSESKLNDDKKIETKDNGHKKSNLKHQATKTE